MRYFIAIFCSPLALLLALRPGAAILNTLLYVDRSADGFCSGCRV
jgi:hypothetical protein